MLYKVKCNIFNEKVDMKCRITSGVWEKFCLGVLVADGVGKKRHRGCSRRWRKNIFCTRYKFMSLPSSAFTGGDYCLLPLLKVPLPTTMSHTTGGITISGDRSTMPTFNVLTFNTINIMLVCST